MNRYQMTLHIHDRDPQSLAPFMPADPVVRICIILSRKGILTGSSTRKEVSIL
jgi:hypothetical protein